MTVDLLVAFWPEVAPRDPPPARPGAAETAPEGPVEAADKAARREGFWSTVLRHLRPRSKVPAVPWGASARRIASLY